MAKRLQRTAPVAGTSRPAGGPSGGETSGPAKKGGRVRAELVTDFTVQLATLAEAGIPVVKALTILEGQTRPGPFKEVLAELVEDVAAGTPLSESMAKHRCFDRLYTSMVKAGEVAGVLDKILNRLATFREKAAAIRSKVVGAMIYPVIVIVVAVGVVSAAILFVIPKFSEIFASFDTKLPLITSMLLAASEIGVKYWYLIFGLPLLVFTLHTLSMRRPGKYRFFFHGLYLRIPLLGPLLSKVQIAAFARTFGTLIEAGVPHLDALTIVRDTTSNDVVAEGVESVRRTVREGEGIARPMGETGMFDDLVVNMVDVGEATGELDRMLLKVATAYEAQVDRRIEALIKFLEPALLIVMAVVVGFIVVALFLPLTEIMGKISSGG
ncbi:MAG: type II secretion system F family protein [Planctomycetes bacterium]|jgi:type IV pilus assembly protein PilC|nr:type II secretion system F family protein [Planctomycetota bacterium]